MRLTEFTDCGLRMLMRMAGGPGRAVSTADLAAGSGASRNHLAEIMALPARAPQDIRLGAVARLLEEGQPLVACLGGGACALDGRCRLKGRLSAAREAFLAELDRATPADIALAPA